MPAMPSFYAGLASLLLLPALFILDWQLPLGVASGVLYVVPVLLTLWASERLLWPVAVLSMLLVLVAIPLSPAELHWMALLNRGFSLLVIGMTALLVFLHGRAERSVTEHVESEERLRRNEQQLLASEQKYRALLDNAVDAILLADLEGNLLDANRAAEELLGYSRAELLQLRAADLHPVEEHPQLFQVFQQIREAGVSVVEHSVIRKDGTVIRCEIAATLIRFGDKAVAQGIFRDITARERRMRERLEQEQAQRDTLVREVHHRIKNNLQGVVGLLREHASAHPELEQAIATAIGQVQSISVVHGLHGQGEDMQVRLCDMVQAIARNASTLTRTAIQPLLELEMPRPMHVHPDEAVPVALVINELIQNAVKHGTRPGNPVTVRLQQDGGGSADVVVAGPGRLAANFDFASGQGLGTGLRLVRSLLPHRGARLEFEQVEGQVRVRLRLEAPVIFP